MDELPVSAKVEYERKLSKAYDQIISLRMELEARNTLRKNHAEMTSYLSRGNIVSGIVNLDNKIYSFTKANPNEYVLKPEPMRTGAH